MRAIIMMLIDTQYRYFSSVTFICREQRSFLQNLLKYSSKIKISKNLCMVKPSQHIESQHVMNALRHYETMSQARYEYKRLLGFTVRGKIAVSP